jgi:ABC-2 type transport system permease protein
LSAPLIVMAIVPTFIYVVAICKLGLPEGNIDMGSTIGSYFGLVFHCSLFSYRNFYFCPIRQSNRGVYHFRIRVLLFLFCFDGLASTHRLLQYDYVSRNARHFKSMWRDRHQRHSLFCQPNGIVSFAYRLQT